MCYNRHKNMVHNKKMSIPKVPVKERLLQKKKERKQKLKEKRARLIVKNLPFKATQENLKEYFEKFGKVQSVDLLKKPDGKLVGCGFIQFQLVQKAAKAKYHLNGKPFLGREITVDFAQPKSKYRKQSERDEKDPQVENGQNEEAVEVKSEVMEVEAANDSNAKFNEYDDTSDDEKSGSCESEIEKDLSMLQKKSSKPYRVSNDISEGRTVFVKNIPFSATNDDLKNCMYQFGPVYYALICTDKFTEHSKGTGFVKFVNKEDAEKALNAGTELSIHGSILDCHPALKREEVKEKANQNKKQSDRDSRNLYLVKEGVILAGTKAAEGVSATDMAKRLQLEQYKTQMLKNLNMFISKERLVIHNLPPNWDDKKLKVLVEKYGGPNAYVKEARIMRDLRNVDANGVGKSKEFGFVTFTSHENALHCLRALNNNPNIFTPNKRPIVTFSIENRSMIKAKQKRLEKSRMNNPLSKSFNSSSIKEKSKQKRELEHQSSENTHEFSGVTAKRGVQKIRSKFNLRTQAKLHHQNLKNEKKKQKLAKKSFNQRKEEFTKQPRQKINKKKENDNFSKLVSQYKDKLLNAAGNTTKSKKWYE